MVVASSAWASDASRRRSTFVPLQRRGLRSASQVAFVASCVVAASASVALSALALV
ncbi:hypothetical protein [Microbacterium sp. Clip185]|uniref:hypothetical protein n=1 Tax=Microbacterium sp. Clip185 TaxID=3025663 RepID=UPI0023657854|nr:hypothetical protein [Microbacterium sp. Clip185]WDG16830.1 hypothetical protein PQV94_09235 [Microbacterium sp. Clip185]